MELGLRFKRQFGLGDLTAGFELDFFRQDERWVLHSMLKVSHWNFNLLSSLSP